MSRGISGGKQVIKFTNMSNQGRVCLFYKNKTMINSNGKRTYWVLARFTSLLFAMRKSTVPTVYKKGTMITSTHVLTLSYWRWKGLYFLLSRINKLNLDFFQWQFFFTCLRPEKPHDIAFIPSVLECVQRCQLSWIRSLRGVIVSCCHGSKTFGSQQTVVLQIWQSKMTCMTFLCMNLHSGRKQ